MTTITIPKNVMTEKDLMIIPRSEYKGLLKRLRIIEKDEQLWKSAAKDKFFKAYSTSDEIYDQV
ncbi:hypothetical protein A3H16_01660 [Candidatus Kaiserbacteria bacterium RIFCSPLOWO2_12_FULL_53_8]|uniref:Uncharacterized protein n=1 Tax=Candidatus Kaiserbacteria bacterium RIFCSPLOWO2_12_FULL_53_8 TaxID=1798529 RepID=A0A1F6G095_9BACT|nr:MAG: hypothetical protein A3H16_01660 [Candidatus Kaiserbacteria bacterium RIFCSPLOWO2_12_FULL_53_8]